MGPFLGVIKGNGKRKESPPFKIHKHKEKLEKDKIKDNTKSDKEEILKWLTQKN